MKTINIEISDELESALNHHAERNTPTVAEGEEPVVLTGLEYFTTRIEDLKQSYLDSFHSEKKQNYLAKLQALPKSDQDAVVASIESRYAALPK